MKRSDVWVLLESVRDGVRVCGTTFGDDEALRWATSRREDKRGAIRVPLDDLADGEVW